MTEQPVIIRFDEVSFGHSDKKPILHEASFSIRRGSKITIMGQNGAGKSTLFNLITGVHKVESGFIHKKSSLSVALAYQVIPREWLDLTLKEYFEKAFKEKVYDIDPRIDMVLDVVHMQAPHDRIVKSFSGGQQARLLLAFALIQDADVLLLDEPTNNLDKAGIAHLTDFLKAYDKTVVVISHDADFLNSFTEGVLYLDIRTQTVEQYVGDYLDVVREISVRIEKENRKNAQFEKQIQANKDKANFFANKGGQMRMVAKRMREKAAEMEEEKVDVRKEDKVIRQFTIPAQDALVGDIITIKEFTMIRNHKPSKRKADITLRKGEHLQLVGPNGIGKTTLLETIALNKGEGSVVPPHITIGYYRQDFSTLNMDHTVFESLESVMKKPNQEELRKTAASFLIGADLVYTKIAHLSEGQKGLVAFARLVLQRPGLLILDEPTNHINFRHLPVIAKALDAYEGAMILVSHVPEFVAQIRIDQVLNLEK